MSAEAAETDDRRGDHRHAVGLSRWRAGRRAEGRGRGEDRERCRSGSSPTPSWSRPATRCPGCRRRAPPSRSLEDVTATIHKRSRRPVLRPPDVRRPRPVRRDPDRRAARARGHRLRVVVLADRLAQGRSRPPTDARRLGRRRSAVAPAGALADRRVQPRVAGGLQRLAELRSGSRRSGGTYSRLSWRSVTSKNERSAASSSASARSISCDVDVVEVRADELGLGLVACSRRRSRRGSAWP